MSEEVENNLRASAIRLSALVAALEDFASQLIAKGNHSDAVITEIKTAVIRNLKNGVMKGVSMEGEVRVYEAALSDIEKLMNNAVDMGKNGRAQ